MSMSKRMVKLAEAGGYTLTEMKQALDDVRNEHCAGGISIPMYPISPRDLLGEIVESTISIREVIDVRPRSGCSVKELEHFKGVDERLKLSEEEDQENLLRLMAQAKVGDALIIHGFHESPYGEYKFTSTYRLDPEGWVWVEHYNERQEKMPTSRRFFTGIRQMVADKLGVPLNDDFHEVFTWVASA